MDRDPKPTKSKVEPKPRAARKPTKSEDSRAQDALEKRLAEALERQRTTSEILSLISNSPTDAQPVFQAIAARAAHLCRAQSVIVFQVQSAMITTPVAAVGASAESLAFYQSREPIPVSSEALGAQAVRERKIIHVPHALEDPDLPRTYRDLARHFGTGAFLIVPIARGTSALGVILAGRREPVPFSEAEIGLLTTFADQAAIAIENVRLLNERQAKNRDLTEALAQQTAISDILKLVSRSAFQLQSVLEALVENATRLCGAANGVIYQFDGKMARLAAAFNTDPDLREFLEQNPIQPARTSTVGRVLLERRTILIEDVLEDGEYRFVERMGVRTTLGVPMLREDGLLGVIVIWRNEVKPFTDRQIELVTTFADQAVIAIENVRLFTELETRNSELTEALDRQTATAEILRVISQAQTEVQPVFDAIVKSGTTLCDAAWGAVVGFDGQRLTLMAQHNMAPSELETLRAMYPRPATRRHATGRAVIDRRTIHIPDIREDPDYLSPAQQALGFRTVLAVPMLRDGEPIGVLALWRREVRRFADQQIALMETFADQAVIAIENVRLFTELQARTQELGRSVGQLTALGEVGRAVSSTLDLETVLSTIVSRAIQLSGTDGGSVYEYDEATEEFSLRASRDLPEAYVEQVRDTRPRKGEGAVGRVAQTREPVQIADISDPAAYASRVRTTLLQIGLRALLAVPLIAEDQLVWCAYCNAQAHWNFRG